MNKVEREDLLRINLLNDVVMSHDGKWIAYIKQRVYETTPNYRSVLVLQNLENGTTEEIVSGNDVSHAIFAEDNRSVFFLGRATEMKQLYRYYFDSKCTEQITCMHRGINTYTLGTGDNVCFFLSDVSAKDADEDLFCEMTKEEKESRDRENSVHHITSMQYRMDGQGYEESTLGQIFVLKKSGQVVRLNQPRVSFMDISVSPQGKYLAAISDPIEEPDMKPEHNIFWGYDVEKSEFEQWTTDGYVMQWPVWAGDEKRAFFCGHDYRYGWNTLFRLYEYDIEKAECCCISEDLDVEFVDSGITDLRGGSGNRGLKYCSKENCFFFLCSIDGSTYVSSYRLSDGALTMLTEGKEHVYSFDLTENKIVYIFTNPVIPNDIKVFSRETKETKVITNSNKEYLDSVMLSVPQAIRATSKDGLEVHGFIMRPIGCEEGKKYPAILEIHGGPSLMYSYAFMHEFQYFAANGYAVFYCNPRGGSGRGQEFEAGIIGAKGGRGTNDFWDLMAITDVVEKFDFVDEKHIGVTGGSYGGLMTNWVVTHTARYQAAITQRSIVNLLSFRGTSDLGFVDPANSYQVDYFDDDYLHSMSPLTYAKNVETPLCILHSENDYRCPVTQAQELFSTLKVLGKTVEMYIFPNSSHGLSRTGQYTLRIQRLEIMLHWFERFLK